MISRLISGGQSGVDRAALDAALGLGVPCGGWCPRGRKAEDGRIDDRYPLTETPTDDHAQRTTWNVRDSDGTLILTWGEPAGGTLLTAEECRRVGKPHLLIDLAEVDRPEAVGAVREWIARELPGGVLNVAGPRGSEHPSVYPRAKAFAAAVLGGGSDAGSCRGPSSA
jgi:hypothetical protein